MKQEMQIKNAILPNEPYIPRLTVVAPYKITVSVEASDGKMLKELDARLKKTSEAMKSIMPNTSHWFPFISTP